MRAKLSHAEWVARYSRMRDMADRICRMRTERARRYCKEAGLDPQLLGIHPHNAMCGLHHGQPWAGINYSLVRKCIRTLNQSFEPYRILEAWDKRVRLS